MSGNLKKMKRRDKNKRNCVRSFNSNSKFQLLFLFLLSCTQHRFFFSPYLFLLKLKETVFEHMMHCKRKCSELCNYQTVNTLNQNYSAGTGYRRGSVIIYTTLRTTCTWTYSIVWFCLSQHLSLFPFLYHVGFFSLSLGLKTKITFTFDARSTSIMIIHSFIDTDPVGKKYCGD